MLGSFRDHSDKEYRELRFDLTKEKGKLTVIFRIFADGVAFRYEVDADTTDSSEKTVVTAEASEFSFPEKGKIVTIPQSATYEAYEYSRSNISDLYGSSAIYSTPALAELAEDSGNCFVLISEANVYNEETPFCASIFKTEKNKKSLQMRFGKYLVQETDDQKAFSKYSPNYADIKEVSMTDKFHTPWRAAVISDDLEGIANSSLITDVNPAAQKDFSWVEPGSSVWSWWSTSADAIEYRTMRDYIDFAAECNFKYCLVDYGWEMWSDYKEKIAELVEYANKKNVGLLLWYGVNKFDADHKFALNTEERIREQFAWCQEAGVKGVKVDYINSDSPHAMKVMYHLADLAADYHLVLNYHGATNPNGENRTYPNILSSEAVAGMENYKWSNGSSVSTLLTLPYTRNVIGSMEFTPTAYRVDRSPATSGFMLAMSVVYESAVQTFAESAYVYPGYAGLSLIADVPTSWDESRLVSGYPGESVIRARRKGENWYLGAMTKKAATYQVPLDFLESGATYHAYFYKDNEKGDDIVVSSKDVKGGDVISLDLLANGGCSVKFTKTEPLKTTIYDNYDYYEAEDSRYASLAGEARLSKDEYASGLQIAGYIGKPGNTLTFSKIPAAKAGEYELKIFYISGSARNLTIKVNEGEPVQLSGLVGVSGDWNAVVSTSVKVQMKEGENTIVLYHDSEDTPNIDRIAVSKDASDVSAAGTVERVTVTPEKAEVTQGVGVNFSAEVTGSNISDSSVTWSLSGNTSTNTTISQDGKLMVGNDEEANTLTIRAASVMDPSKSAVVVVTVKKKAAEQGSGQNQPTDKPASDTQKSAAKVTKITIPAKKLKIAAGKKVKLPVTVEPANAANKSLIWSVPAKYKKYASVTQTGVVSLKKKGAGKTVEVLAEAADGSKVKASVKIKIMKHAVKKLTRRGKAKRSVKAGSKITLKVKVKTSGKKVNKKLSWTVSNSQYASVSAKGVVSTKKAGKGKTVSVTVCSTDGTNKKATFTVKIK